MFGWFRRKKTPSPCMRQRLREWLRSVPKCKECGMSPEAFDKLQNEMIDAHRVMIGRSVALSPSGFYFGKVFVYPDPHVAIDFMAQ